MRIMCYIISLLILGGCIDTHKRESHKIQITSLDFLMSKKYAYSTSKLDIPSTVLDSIGSINKETFKIGDSTDAGKISFSDARLLTSKGEDFYEYKRKLHFVLVSDTFCLIVYTEGGLGTHDVIDFLKYKGEYKHVRYITADILSDTIKLENFLRSYPTKEKLE